MLDANTSVPALHRSGRVLGFDAVRSRDLVPCDVSTQHPSSRSREKHPGLHTTPGWPILLPEARQMPCCNAALSESSTILPRLHIMWHFYVDADLSSGLLAGDWLGFLQVPTKRSVRKVQACCRGGAKSRAPRRMQSIAGPGGGVGCKVACQVSV
jgi:hypothetical protein